MECVEIMNRHGEVEDFVLFFYHWKSIAEHERAEIGYFDRTETKQCFAIIANLLVMWIYIIGPGRTGEMETGKWSYRDNDHWIANWFAWLLKLKSPNQRRALTINSATYVNISGSFNQNSMGKVQENVKWPFKEKKCHSAGFN